MYEQQKCVDKNLFFKDVYISKKTKAINVSRSWKSLLQESQLNKKKV